MAVAVVGLSFSLFVFWPRLMTRGRICPQVLEELVTGDAVLAPVNAVLGGVLANEILKVISHKGEPVNNFFFFSLMDNVGQIETLG